MGSDVAVTKIPHKFVPIIAFVGSQGNVLRATQIIDELHGGIPLCRSICCGDLLSSDQVMPVIHEHMVPQIG